MKRFGTRYIALLVITAAAIYVCWNMLLPFIDVIAWAAVLVVVFYPVHKRIEARLNSPSWAAVVSCALVILTILLPLTFASFAVINEARDFAQRLQDNGGNLVDMNNPTIQRALDWVGQYVDVSKFQSQDFIVERVRGMSGTIANRTLGLVGGLAGAIVQVFFIIFTMYYLFRDGRNVRKSLYKLIPLSHDETHRIFVRTRDVISASVYGVVVIALIQGVLGAIGFWICGLPSILLWGVVMTLFSMIPLAGAFVVWVPAAIYLFATGSVGYGIFLTVWGAVVIGSIDNFLRPKLVGEKTRLHELLIFFSVLGGLQVFGVLGLVLGPVMLVITLALIDVLQQAEDEDGQPEPSLLEGQENIRNVADSDGVQIETAR